MPRQTSSESTLLSLCACSPPFPPFRASLPEAERVEALLGEGEERLALSLDAELRRRRVDDVIHRLLPLEAELLLEILDHLGERQRRAIAALLRRRRRRRRRRSHDRRAHDSGHTTD